MKHLIAFVLSVTIGAIAGLRLGHPWILTTASCVVGYLIWTAQMVLCLPHRSLAEPVLAGGGWIRRYPETNHELFWVSPWQSFVISMAKLVPRVHNKIAKENAAYLEIVREYKPRIIAQYDEYEAAFNGYEMIDVCYDPDGYKKQEVMRRREKAATERVHGLTRELQEKLNLLAWPYRDIADFESLLWAHENTVDRDHVDRYWNKIEFFLVARAK